MEEGAHYWNGSKGRAYCQERQAALQKVDTELNFELRHYTPS